MHRGRIAVSSFQRYRSVMASSSLKQAYTIVMSNMKWLLVPLVGVLAVSWHMSVGQCMLLEQHPLRASRTAPQPLIRLEYLVMHESGLQCMTMDVAAAYTGSLSLPNSLLALQVQIQSMQEGGQLEQYVDLVMNTSMPMNVVCALWS